MKGPARRRSPLDVPLSQWSLEQVRDLAAATDGYLWPNPATGIPMRWVDGIFRSAFEKAGVRPFSAHDLRTTGASWLRAAGVDELVIVILLGHRGSFDAGGQTHHVRSAEVTRQYTKVFNRALQEAVAVFDTLRLEIDPPVAGCAEEGANESARESAHGVDLTSYWTGRSYGGQLASPTGFEPVLPP